jgi:hypothetical protein
MSTPYGLGALPSPLDYRDYPLAALYAARGVEPAAAVAPTYVTPGELGPVLNQGNTPQCVAYSSAGLKLYEDRIDQGAWFDFDESKFFSRIGGGPDGAYLRDAMAQLLNVGYPLRAIDDAGAHKVAAYYAVPLSQADIQGAILAFGPLVIALTWDDAWFTPRSDGTLPAPRGTSAGGHAIKAIGWDARGLRLRNSWGSTWGQGGDCYLPWAYLPRVWEAWKAVDQIITPEVSMFSPAAPTASCDVAKATAYADLLSREVLGPNPHPAVKGVPLLGYDVRPRLDSIHPPVKVAWVAMPEGIGIVDANFVSNVKTPAPADVTHPVVLSIDGQPVFTGTI